MRSAALHEIDALAALWHAGWQDAHANLLPAELARHRTLESFKQRLRDQLADVRVAGEVGAPLGFAMLKDDELYQFYVAKAARGTGLAAALLRDVEGALRVRGVENAWLACAIGNERAGKFYARNGWHLAGNAVLDLPLPEGGVFKLEVWRYEKSLN